MVAFAHLSSGKLASHLKLASTHVLTELVAANSPNGVGFFFILL